MHADFVDAVAEAPVGCAAARHVGGGDLGFSISAASSSRRDIVSSSVLRPATRDRKRIVKKSSRCIRPPDITGISCVDVMSSTHSISGRTF